MRLLWNLKQKWKSFLHTAKLRSEKTIECKQANSFHNLRKCLSVIKSTQNYISAESSIRGANNSANISPEVQLTEKFFKIKVQSTGSNRVKPTKTTSRRAPPGAVSAEPEMNGQQTPQACGKQLLEMFNTTTDLDTWSDQRKPACLSMRVKRCPARRVRCRENWENWPNTWPANTRRSWSNNSDWKKSLPS